MPSDTPLTSPDTVIVLAQALTGLGHLRVTHALYHGLPQGAHAVLLSSQDTRVNALHKLTSINPLLRHVMEFVQNGWAEDVFTYFARRYFRQNTKLLEEQLQTILEQHMIKPKTLLVVATHTNLAHQLAAIKEHFAATNGIKIVLVVVVTDDSPQHLWAVGGADIIVVPSDYTKRTLESYHRSQSQLAPSTYVVLPYMVTPGLGVELSDSQLKRRKQEVDPDRLAAIHMAIPVSGAAVQLAYFEKIIRELEGKSDRFVFHIVSHQSPATTGFLAGMIGNHHIKLHVSPSHREVVELYERLYEHEVIALEVTKPSEQSFKALLKPRHRGGAILLFSEPVGRQEWDNLRFLIRHNLLPTVSEQQALWGLVQRDKPISHELLMRAHVWRGLRLPFHSNTSANFIWWSLQRGLLAAMMRFSGFQENHELSSRGVEMFWDYVSHHLSERIA